MEILKTLIIFLTFIILLNPSWALEISPRHYFQKGCSLYNFSGSLAKNFPGFICIFLDDGRIVSSNDQMIRVLSPDGETIWEKSGNYHHQINLTLDGQSILAISSDIQQEKGEMVRYDHFVNFSLDGDVLRENSIRLMAAGDLLDNKVSQVFQGLFQNTTRERSHFNSIFEIGDVKPNSAYPGIKKGNIIANSLFLGIFILSADFKTVLHQFKLPGSVAHLVHDVQVLPNGNFLLFNNESKPKDSVYPESAMQEVDPVTLKPVYSFSGEPGVPLYSSHCGGVQKLDDEYYLYSHMINGNYIVSRKTGKIVKSVFEPNLTNGRITPVQNLRLVKISEKFINLHLK